MQDVSRLFFSADWTTLSYKTLYHFSYTAFWDPQFINYNSFCMALNKVNHVGDTEPASGINPQTLFANTDDDTQNFLDYDERNRMAEILQNILRQSRVTVSSLEDIFKDYAGRCNIITRYAMEKVIKNSNLAETVTSDDMDLIFKCFSQSCGLNLRKFNYINFVQALQTLEGSI